MVLDAMSHVEKHAMASLVTSYHEELIDKTYSDDPDPGLYGCVKETFDRKHSFGAEFSGFALQQSPVNVYGNSVETNSFDLLKNVKPE